MLLQGFLEHLHVDTNEVLLKVILSFCLRYWRIAFSNWGVEVLDDTLIAVVNSKSFEILTRQRAMLLLLRAAVIRKVNEECLQLDDNEDEELLSVNI